MQIETSNDDLLLAEIEAAFPREEMPAADELTISEEGWSECNNLRDDLDAIRGRPLTGETFRLVHQDLRCLSKKGLRWILPHYLRYCISAEGQYSRMETQFLIYNLSPKSSYREETLQRFKFLNIKQIECLCHFLDWCANHPHWREYLPADLQDAMGFMQLLMSLRNSD
jgi:hypothetical protein